MHPILRNMLAVALVLLAAYFLYFDFMLPRYAANHLPGSWEEIGLNQTRETLYARLGLPDVPGDTEDTWRKAEGNDEYQLKVRYKDGDRSYRLDYLYKYQLWFIKRNYQLRLSLTPR